MRFLKKILIWFLGILVLLIMLMYVFNVNYLLKAVRTIYLNGHKTAFLEDYQYFDNRTIKKGIAQPWAVSIRYNTVKPTAELQKMHDETGTIAFLIIKNDSIWSENYYDGFNKDSKSNSFSMAKSIVSASLGKAILEGKIKSLDQKVADFFPEFTKQNSNNLTVGDLSSMSSGLNWDESYYSPFSITTRAYFDEDLKGVVLGLKGISESGKSYKYLSGDTQLLGMCIEKATGKSLADYVSESFWKPMGAENEALWQTDKENGIVKAYCCIASNARDFARFGKLYRDFGKWNGEQVLDSAFVAKSIRPRFADSPEYGYGWWLHQQDGKQFFMMRGHLGQYVIVEPKDNVIIIRLGHKKSSDAGIGKFTKDIMLYIEESYKMLEKTTSVQ